MSIEPFIRPRLTGARFEGHAIPLEFLKDLAVFEEMVVEVAKAQFLDDNPKRKRSPRGFTDGIELRLTGVEDGSAIPVIALVVLSNTLLPPGNQQYFEKARDSIVSAIDAAAKNEPIVAHLPEKSLYYFDKMGRSLRQDEAIEFTVPGKPLAAKLTKGTRRKLILAAPGTVELTEEASVRGTVPEADQDRMTFELQMADQRRITAPMSSQHLDTILEAFAAYKQGMRVLLTGVGRFNRSNRLLSFDAVEHVSILDPLDTSARFEELAQLQDGWLDGIGKAPDANGLMWLAKQFDDFYPDSVDLPHLYPTEDGGIQAEWFLSPFDVSLDVDLAERKGTYHSLNLETDAEESRDIDLGQESGWGELLSLISNASGGVDNDG